jgi:hypothetical protein
VAPELLLNNRLEIVCTRLAIITFSSKREKDAMKRAFSITDAALESLVMQMRMNLMTSPTVLMVNVPTRM